MYAFLFFWFGLVFVFLCLFLSLPLSLMISFDDLWLSFKCFTVNVREFVNLCRSTWLYFDIVFHCYYGRYYCYCCCYASTYFVVWFDSLTCLLAFFFRLFFILHTQHSLWQNRFLAFIFIHSPNRRVFFTFHQFPSYSGIAILINFDWNVLPALLLLLLTCF